MGSSRTLNSLKNATINLVAKLSSILCSFIIRTIFLKYLGDQYTGVSTLFTDILNILSFTELGIGTAISFAFYKPIAENDEKKIAELMCFCKYAYTIISIMVLVLGFALIPTLGFFVKDVPDIKEDITYIYILYVIKTSCSYLLIYKSTLLIAKQKQFIVTATESVCTILKTVLDVLIIMATRNFLLYLYLEIARVVVSNFIISSFSDAELRHNKYYRKVKVKLSEFKGLFSNVKDVFIYKVNGIILTSTDSLIISRVISTATVTYISNYNLIFNAINNIAYQAISAVTASVGNLAVLKSRKEQKNVFYTINFMCYVFTSVAVVGLWMCANPFIEMIWGDNYVLPQTIVLMLCMNLFMVNMHMVVDMFRNANGIFHEGRMRPLATAIINLLVSVVAAHFIGLHGVLLGTVVSRLTTQVWYDSKLIFKLVFKENVKNYYIRYICYCLITIFYCAIGSLLGNLCSNVVVKFIVGAIFATIGTITIDIVIFRKTETFKSSLNYFAVVLKRGLK